jgi:DNA-binding MarR family transcriptional regulator
MLQRKTQIESILQSIHAIKHQLLTGNYILSPHNQIPGSQWIVLRIVFQNEGIGIKELSGFLGISSSAATQLVDSLVKKGLLIREQSPDDRRALKIRLTAKTNELIENAQSRVLEKVHSLFDGFSDEELQQYCDLSSKFAARILSKQAGQK